MPPSISPILAIGDLKSVRIARCSKTRRLFARNPGLTNILPCVLCACSTTPTDIAKLGNGGDTAEKVPGVTPKYNSKPSVYAAVFNPLTSPPIVTKPLELFAISCVANPSKQVVSLLDAEASPIVGNCPIAPVMYTGVPLFI